MCKDTQSQRLVVSEQARAASAAEHHQHCDLVALASDSRLPRDDGRMPRCQAILGEQDRSLATELSYLLTSDPASEEKGAQGASAVGSRPAAGSASPPAGGLMQDTSTWSAASEAASPAVRFAGGSAEWAKALSGEPQTSQRPDSRRGPC